jgi:hypothetical protein
MTKVIFVGEMYYSDLSVGGGPMPGGPGAGAPGVPTHPIYNPAYPDQGLPGWQPRPSHPIAPGGGGPVDPGYGVPIGGRPSHPIYNPAYPDNSLPGNQPYPDNSLPGSQPRPTPPIYIGPIVPTPEPEPIVEWHSAWSPQTGWMTIGVPSGAAPTPSE